MFYLRLIQYAVFAAADFLFMILSCVVFNWWVPFFAVTYTNDRHAEWTGKPLQRLPKWLAWFDTFDASTDAGWRDHYFTDKYTVDNPPKYWRRKWYQVKWLYRNPAYGFSYSVLGINMDVKQWEYTYTKYTDGDLWLALSKDGHFNVAYGGKWGSYKLGWKAWNYFDSSTQQWKPNYQWGPKMRTQCVFSVNPIKGLVNLIRGRK